MKIAFQVPIKARSSIRVPNKNFREIAGKPLFAWLLDELLTQSGDFESSIFVDSENESVYSRISEHYEKDERLNFHLRRPWYAEDHANGNHLLSQFAMAQPQFDIYVQVFITAVTLRRGLIDESLRSFTTSLDQFDSMFLVSEEPGWIWFKGNAINYDPTRPDGLPRSQDAMYLKETTGLYAITKDALLRTGCRIGCRPMLYKVDRFSSVDIDTMSDFAEAEKLLMES